MKNSDGTVTKSYSIEFSSSELDIRFLKAYVAALQSEALSARFGHSVEYDTETEKTTLKWWRLPTGGFNAK
jgi:hypothetical protein